MQAYSVFDDFREFDFGRINHFYSFRRLIFDPTVLQKALRINSETGLLLKAKGKEILTFSGNALREWRAIILNHANHSRNLHQIIVRRIASEEFDDCAPQTPNIAASCGISGHFNSFWCHPIGSPHKGDSFIIIRQTSRYSKVRELHNSVLCCQDVCTFYVAMHYSLAVQIFQTY